MISLTELLNAEEAFIWAMEKEKTEMMSNLEKAQLEWFKKNMGLTGKLDRIAAALEKLSAIFGSDIDKIAELIKDAESEEEDKEDDRHLV